MVSSLSVWRGNRIKTGFHMFVITEHVSIGAMADSGYEYLLKQYLLTSQTDKDSLEMCTSIPPPYVFLVTLIAESHMQM